MSECPGNPDLHLVSGARRAQDASMNRASMNLSAYRPYTRALLRRYFRMAVDIGRLPSILGGLCFRARVSSYRLNTFEDAVIFVHDIERVFERIQRHYLEIIAGVILLDYSVPEAALRLGITVQRAERRYYAALDALSDVLLEVGLLRPIFTSEAADQLNLAAPNPCFLPRSHRSRSGSKLNCRFIDHLQSNSTMTSVGLWPAPHAPESSVPPSILVFQLYPHPPRRGTHTPNSQSNQSLCHNHTQTHICYDRQRAAFS